MLEKQCVKILYVGPLDKNNSALYRLWALERMGQQNCAQLAHASHHG
jgi:hypothetical protein